MIAKHLLIGCALCFCCSIWAKEQRHERVIVVGKPSNYLNGQTGILPVERIDSTNTTAIQSLADTFTTHPQVNFNGQGGLFQTVSIRGLSRWRIQTLVEGVPIYSDRRAGNTAEFIPPNMLGAAYLLSGAASTQLGSGALGGGVDMQLASSLDTLVSANVAAQQDYRSLQLLDGVDAQNRAFYWGASYRHANGSEDAAHQLLNNGFEQSLGWVRQVSEDQGIEDALILFSRANNVGKASADPVDERITQYPVNDHWLGKLDFSWMNTRVYGHSAELHTEIVRPEQRINTLQNTAKGWGVSIGNDIVLNTWTLDWRLALDARSGVRANEQEFTTEGDKVFSRTNLAASQRDWSLTLNTDKQWHGIALAGGARLSHTTQTPQRDINTARNENTNISGFFGVIKPWSPRWSAGLYLSSAFRVPTLTELFFVGTTPRGTTLGDPTLTTEHARNIQFNTDYVGENLSVNVSVFHQSIDDYIERITLSDTLQQYVNIGNGKIDGASYRAMWSLSPSLFLHFQGQWLWGENELGAPLSDVSPHRHDVKIRWQSDVQKAWLNLTYRQAHTRVGSGELPTAPVVYLQAGYEHIVTTSFSYSVLLTNLTNELYPVSTDDLSPNAMARDLVLSLNYVF